MSNISVIVNDSNNITAVVDQGVIGPSGAAATIAVGTTTTLSPGASATVNNSGTSSAAVFNFGVPQGPIGATGATGATGPQGNPGIPGINWLGTWSGATTYAIRDAVAYNGSSYYAIASSTNQAPPNASFWELLAAKGTDGTGAGTVTSVDVSGGTTGLTTSGGPVTSAGTITLAGTLAIANGGTGQTTRQAALDALAGAVTAGQYLRGDGTDVVMSAIQAADVPTLNQNTTGTAANVTGTVAVANGGTGATSFAAAGLATLTGTETLTNKTVEFVDGTAAAPSITNVGDNNTGIFFPAADTIAFAEGGVETARLTSDGNLLIGATSQTYASPTFGYKFGVQSGVSQTYISIAKSGQSLDSGGMVIGIDATGGSVQVLENQPFRFFTNSLQRMTLDASGNLGIGTASPVAKFDLVGDYKEGVVTANTGTTYTINTATGTLQILTLTGNCTFTFPTATTGESFTLFLRQDATGSRTATWPANVRWPGGTAPTITSTALRQDKYVFTADGTNWYGSNAGQNYTV